MGRYIDAEKLTAEFDKCLWGKEWDKALATECANNTPTADVQEVRHGEWKQKAWVDEKMEVHEDILITKCSECGMKTYWLKGEKLWNYCPNCGTRMDL